MQLKEKIKRNKKNVDPKELIDLLLEYGFVYRRSTGDHDIYKRKGYRSFPVPIRQRPLAVHIVQNALRVINEIDANEMS